MSKPTVLLAVAVTCLAGVFVVQVSTSRAAGATSVGTAEELAAPGAVRGDVPSWVVGTVNNPPFSLRDHFALGRPARACAEILSRAAVRQDVLNAASSAAHFDNCAFDQGLEYIARLEREAGALFGEAESNRLGSGEISAASRRQVHEGVYRLGQALHAVQDFYSHSNFVEIEELRVSSIGLAEQLRFYGGQATTRVKGMVASGGLHSGTWSIGFPKQCPSGSPTHGDMAKDHSDSGKGSSKSRWGQSYHFSAMLLARSSTEAYLDDATRAWPILAQVCNPPYGMNSPREDRKGQ